jgi:hypothetical protein
MSWRMVAPSLDRSPPMSARQTKAGKGRYRMRRRDLCAALVGFQVSRATMRPAQAAGPAEDPNLGAKASLIPSGPVTSGAEGQIIEGLDISAPVGSGIAVSHRGVTIRNCRVRHTTGHGIHGTEAQGLVLRDLEIVRVSGQGPNDRPRGFYNNIDLDRCAQASILRVRASGGSSNIYIKESEATHLSRLELHDARGPFPRGQNVQFNRSPRSVLEDFSGENGPSSWTEDNVSVFRSDGCTVRRGLVSYNNSPTGDGVMIEGSFDCLVEDVDAVQQGNGAFAAVPEDDAGSGGCTFRRCRTRATYNSARDGRAAPSSNGLSFYMLISQNARRHTIIDCHYDTLANPDNLVWDSRSLNDDWAFTHQAFTPRRPIRLNFGWR